MYLNALIFNLRVISIFLEVYTLCPWFSSRWQLGQCTKNGINYGLKFRLDLQILVLFGRRYKILAVHMGCQSMGFCLHVRAEIPS